MSKDTYKISPIINNFISRWVAKGYVDKKTSLEKTDRGKLRRAWREDLANLNDMVRIWGATIGGYSSAFARTGKVVYKNLADAIRDAQNNILKPLRERVRALGINPDRSIRKWKDEELAEIQKSLIEEKGKERAQIDRFRAKLDTKAFADAPRFRKRIDEIGKDLERLVIRIQEAVDIILIKNLEYSVYVYGFYPSREKPKRVIGIEGAKIVRLGVNPPSGIKNVNEFWKEIFDALRNKIIEEYKAKLVREQFLTEPKLEVYKPLSREKVKSKMASWLDDPLWAWVISDSSTLPDSVEKLKGDIVK